MFACTFNNRLSSLNTQSIDNIGISQLLTVQKAIINDLSVENIEISGYIIPSNNNVNIGDIANRFNKIYVNELSCNTINGNPLESFTGTGGGLSYEYLQNYFNYYFVNKPLAPVYITEGSFSDLNNIVPPIRTEGTFDFSSGRYSNETQEIILQWINPPQKHVGINFPANFEFNYSNSYKLPYHEFFYIEYIETQGISEELLTYNNRIQININDSSKNFSVSTDQDASFQAGVGKKYRFRIYLTNHNSSEDISNNYLYFPDLSSSMMSIGNYGKATSPTDISILTILHNLDNFYSKLDISGRNGNSQDTRAEDILNKTFSDLLDISLSVKYGFELVINKDGSSNISSKQYYKPESPYDYSIFKILYESNPIKKHYWNISEDFTLTEASNVSISNNNIVFPGYTYDISNYYMILSSSNNEIEFDRATKSYMISGYPPMVIVPPPKRENVTHQYLNYLQPNDISSLDLSYISGTSYYTISGLYTKDGSNAYNINFFSQNSKYILNIPNNIPLKLNNSRKNRYIEWNIDASSGDYGENLKDQSLCRFILSSSGENYNLNTINYTSSWRVGFDDYDQSEDSSNDYFRLSQSKSIDALLGNQYYSPLNNIENYRLRGWYLGVEISNIEIKNINLDTYPDICNNNYQPWVIKLKQEFAPKNIESPQSPKEAKFDFKIAKKPDNDISLIDFSNNTPISSFDRFFGLYRPNADISFIISGQLIDIDPNWRLYNNNILQASLYYIDNSFYNFNIPWRDVSSTNYSISNELLIELVKLKESSFNYSRDNSNAIQFSISGNYERNPMELGIQEGAQSTPTLNLTESVFNDRQLWWDFTWLNTNDAPSDNWKFDGTTISDFNQKLMNVGNGLYPSFNEVKIPYDHSQEISDNMMMWTKGAFRSGNSISTDITEHPFIDYTIYYGQNSDVSYDDLSNSGTLLNINYYDGFTISNDHIGYGFISHIYHNTSMSVPSWYSNSSNIKFIVIKYRKSSNSNISICKFVAKSTSRQLSLGTDYYLQVMESDTDNISLTEWRDCQKYSRTASNNERIAEGGPAYWKYLDYYDSQNDISNYNIQIVNSTQNLILYFRLGLPIDSSNNISEIVIDGSNYGLADSYFGRPTSPTDISINNITYKSFDVSGANNSGYVTKDSYGSDQREYDNDGLNDLNSLNGNPYNQGKLYVKYGFKIIINKNGTSDISSYSKQYNAPTDLFIHDTSFSFETSKTQNNSWISNWSYYTELYAGYTIDVSGYYMRLYSDELSGNYNPFPTYSTIELSGIRIPHPSRSIVTNGINGDYYSNFSGTILDNWSSPPTGANEYTIYRKGSQAEITVKFLPNLTASYELTTSNQSFKVRVSSNRDLIDNDLSYGTLLDSSLCRFIMSSDSLSASAAPLLGSYIQGWDSTTTNNNSNAAYSFTQSDPSDIASGYVSDVSAESKRLKGWYLGVDITNIKATINLNNFPDIANRSGSSEFKPYSISFTQEFIDGTIVEVSSNQEIFVALLPSGDQIQDISYNTTLKTYDICMRSQADFFGLYRPARPPNNIIAKAEISGSFYDISDSAWRWSNTIVENVQLKYYDESSVNIGGYFDISWPSNHSFSKDFSENYNILYDTVIDNSYSRDLVTKRYFQITGNDICNNFPKSSISFQTISAEFGPNNKQLWWDFTWGDTYSNPPGIWSVNFSTDFMNVGDGLYPDLSEDLINIPYDHSQEIPYNMMMWCNGGFRAGEGGGGANRNPFVNYNNFYNNTNDYSSLNNSGISINSIDYSTGGGGYIDHLNNFGFVYPPSSLYDNQIKFIVLKYKPSGSNRINIIIKDGSSELNIGSDYFMQVMEYDPTIYYNVNGVERRYSGWRDAQRHEAGSTYLQKQQDGGPCRYTSGNFKIHIISTSSYVITYLRIGLPVNSGKKISFIQITSE